MTIKTCTKCKKEMDISNFSPLIRGGHKPRCKKCQMDYYYENRDKILEYSKEYRKTYTRPEYSKEKKKEYMSNYKKSEKYKLYHSNYKNRRRQIVNNSDNSVTQEALDFMLESQNCLCNICNANISERNTRHLDHIYPISKGGLHTIANLQWLCIKCNLSKAAKLPQ